METNSILHLRNIYEVCSIKQTWQWVLFRYKFTSVMINDDSALKNLIVSENDRQDSNVSYDKEVWIVC